MSVEEEFSDNVKQFVKNYKAAVMTFIIALKRSNTLSEECWATIFKQIALDVANYYNVDVVEFVKIMYELAYEAKKVDDELKTRL